MISRFLTNLTPHNTPQSSTHMTWINSHNLFISTLVLDKQPYSDRGLTNLTLCKKISNCGHKLISHEKDLQMYIYFFPSCQTECFVLFYDQVEKNKRLTDINFNMREWIKNINVWLAIMSILSSWWHAHTQHNRLKARSRIFLHTNKN